MLAVEAVVHDDSAADAIIFTPPLAYAMRGEGARCYGDRRAMIRLRDARYIRQMPC